MHNIALYAVIYVAVLFAIVAYLYLTAVEGWEDEDGFHYGRRPPGKRPRGN